MSKRGTLLFGLVLACFTTTIFPIPILPLLFSQTPEATVAVAVTIADLTEQARNLDGATVIITGEAIAPPMIRGTMAWVNIEDSSGAVGVWMTLSEMRRITFFGSYSASGDILRVVGIFSRACSSHGGDLDVHAISTTILEKGQRQKHFLTASRIVISIVLAGCSLAVLGLSLIRNVRTRVAAKQEKNGNHVRI